MWGVVAFDLEISKELPEGCDDWRQHAPLGISCAVTYADGVLDEWLVWTGERQSTGLLAPAMAPQQVRNLVDYLLYLTTHGYVLVGLNSLGFDLRVLAEESQDEKYFQACSLMAYKSHIDIGFQLVAEKGFMVSLQAASLGMGMEGKLEGMSGSQAPKAWRESSKKQELVIAYCKQDVKATYDLYTAIVDEGCMRWVSKAGQTREWYPQFKNITSTGKPRLLTVEESMRLPEPVVREGSTFKPWPRARFSSWLTFSSHV